MTGMTYLLRLVLPDRPGSLGAVATVLGNAGIDIESLDVVERGPDGAVDDLVVTLPSNALVDGIITAVRSVHGVEVESVRPFPRASETVRDLDVVDRLAADPGSAGQVLVTLSPEAFRASWAMLIETTPFGHTRVEAASAAAPAQRDFDAPWLPLRAALRFPLEQAWMPPGWVERGTELCAAPVGGQHRALLLGRTGGPMFRPAEVLRLAHLAGVAGAVSAVGAGPDEQAASLAV